jgi:hypothetical protein
MFFFGFGLCIHENVLHLFSTDVNNLRVRKTGPGRTGGEDIRCRGLLPNNR